MTEGKEAPSREWEQSPYADDIRRMLRNRESDTWLEFDNPATATDPGFLEGVADALRSSGRVPVWMEQKMFPEDSPLHLDDIHRKLVTQIIASLPEQERPNFLRYQEALAHTPPRE